MFVALSPQAGREPINDAPRQPSTTVQEVMIGSRRENQTQARLPGDLP
ncbi:MAG: hypothetical protein IIB38_05255 [Candidatus Hydrogenedentes bacterium]|nr:hypothetical protein [Candidatus Hydrogenedentota bacterium]